jgi:ADP-ribose pyrophosphatase YjhB (NUDIX family)
MPGGTVELGEGLEEALVREMLEETGVVVRPLELLTVFDRIERRDGEVLWHFVIADYLCSYVSGAARAGSDALEVAWASRSELPAYDLPEKARQVVEQGFVAAGAASRPPLAPGSEPG